VLYDKKRGQIVTFLYQDPADYLKPGPGRVADGRLTLISPRQRRRIESSPGLVKVEKTSTRYVEWSSGGKLNREKAERIQEDWEAWLLGEKEVTPEDLKEVQEAMHDAAEELEESA